jgi:hypothetical protein
MRYTLRTPAAYDVGLIETGNDATGLQGPTHAPYTWFIAECGRSERDNPVTNYGDMISITSKFIYWSGPLK